MTREKEQPTQHGDGGDDHNQFNRTNGPHRAASHVDHGRFSGPLSDGESKYLNHPKAIQLSEGHGEDMYTKYIGR